MIDITRIVTTIKNERPFEEINYHIFGGREQLRIKLSGYANGHDIEVNHCFSWSELSSHYDPYEFIRGVISRRMDELVEQARTLL